MSDQRDWNEIDHSFSRKQYTLTYQEQGEARKLTHEDAKEGIKAGWKVGDYSEISQWINRGFSAEEVKGLANVGLGKNDRGIASYIRGMNYSLESIKGRFDNNKKEELIKEFVEGECTPKSLTAHLDFVYPLVARRKAIMIEIDEYRQKNPEASEAIINGNEGKRLREIEFSEIKITSLLLYNCKQLIRIDISKCGINSNLEIFSELVNLELLSIVDNNFSGDLISLSNLVNLKYLNLKNNQLLIGSLQAFENLDKLASLNIEDTNIIEGLEYLPDELINFFYNESSFPEMKGYIIDYSRGKQEQKQKKRISELERQFATFRFREEEIDRLEAGANELLKSIQRLRNEIANIYEKQFSGNDLVKRFISCRFELKSLMKAKAHLTSDLIMQRAIEKQIREKIEEIEKIRIKLARNNQINFAENIYFLLDRCDILASLEEELEQCLIKKTKLIKEQRDNLKLIKDNLDDLSLNLEYHEIVNSDQIKKFILLQINNNHYHGDIIQGIKAGGNVNVQGPVKMENLQIEFSAQSNNF